MKIIKYEICTDEVLIPVEISCSAVDLEANEETAKKEAYNGEYTIEDDGKPEFPISSNNSSIWDELDEAYQNGINSL